MSRLFSTRARIGLIVAVAAFSAVMIVPRPVNAAPDNGPPPGADNDVDAQQVRKAIDRGVDYLERHEDLDANYGYSPDYPRLHRQHNLPRHDGIALCRRSGK